MKRWIPTQRGRGHTAPGDAVERKSSLVPDRSKHKYVITLRHRNHNNSTVPCSESNAQNQLIVMRDLIRCFPCSSHTLGFNSEPIYRRAFPGLTWERLIESPRGPTGRECSNRLIEWLIKMMNGGRSGRASHMTMPTPRAHHSAPPVGFWGV